MTYQQTSLDAYDSIQGTIGQMQLQVYNCIKNLGSANNHILSIKLNYPINRITPRVFELREKGLVEQDGIRTDPKTKRKSIFWRIKREVSE